jgi:hypothetical protein
LGERKKPESNSCNTVPLSDCFAKQAAVYQRNRDTEVLTTDLFISL